ncbi:MAG: GAF domain-containing protein, partial [Anaerolineales bacterium]|nr:GAF domain-containing protein [Anaerolineales bacterium]
QQLIESSFDLVQVVNHSGQFQFVNQAWQDTLGYTAEEWTHLTIWDILHPEEHEHCQQLLKKIYRGDYLPRIKTRMITKHGRVLRMAGSITPNFDQNKTVIGSNGFFHDITEQVNAAQALRQYADRLEILHNIDQAIISTESMEAIASNTLEYLRRLIPCDRVSITVLNAQGQVALLSYNGHTAETVSAGSATPYILQLLEQTISSPDKHFLLPDLNTVDISDVPPLQQLRQAGYQTYLGIPLLADNETIGLFNLNHREANFFQPEDIKIAQEVANHLAIALRQARLYEATQNQLKELRILHAVAQACAEAKTENELVNTVTKLFYAHDLADLFNVLLLNPETNHLYIHPGHEAVHPYVNLPPIPLNEGVTGRVAADQQARYIANTAVEPTYLDLGSHMLSELCVPLVSNGRVLGVLNAERRNTHSFDPFAQRLLTTISGQLSLTMERLRSARNTQRYAQQITTMNEMAQKMTRSLELDQVLQGIIDEVSALVQAEGVAVLLRPATNSDQLEFAAVSGPGARGLQKQHMPADQGIAGHVVRSGKPIAIHNRQQSAGLIYGRAENLSGFQSQSLLAVPIIVDNNTMGVLEAVHSQPNQFSSDSLNLLSAAATWAAIALKNAQLFTQLGEQYQQLQRSQAQLIQAEKLSALGRLVASIAHEINNPIQAIQGCLTLVTEELDRFAERETVDFYLDIVQTELVRVASIVKRMRDFYRPAKEGQFPTAVDDILASVLELSQKQLEYAQVQVSRDWSDDLPLILANPNHLKQVFLNLLLNAVDAMPDGGHLSIMARRATADQEIMLGHTAVVISFQDNGHGIPDTDREQLFEPFFTTKDEGSGLGLSISYNIIQAHNGHILVDSTIGQGTTFTILLPASDV